MPAATTIYIINATTTLNAGSRKMMIVCNPNGTAGALTIVGVEWAGGTTPTQTTTANKTDIYSFSTNDAGSNWFGFVAGLNF